MRYEVRLFLTISMFIGVELILYGDFFQQTDVLRKTCGCVKTT